MEYAWSNVHTEYTSLKFIYYMVYIIAVKSFTLLLPIDHLNTCSNVAAGDTPAPIITAVVRLNVNMMYMCDL